MYSGGRFMSGPEIGVYLPHMGLSYEDVLHRTRRCDELGIDSLWLYDHLYAPGMSDRPSLEAWTLATALLSNTARIRIGHMVLCNQFRHPVVLAKMATTLDQISGGSARHSRSCIRPLSADESPTRESTSRCPTCR